MTSPSVAEGKTSVAARLAMAYSEKGKRVLVLSCDFQRRHRSLLSCAANVLSRWPIQSASIARSLHRPEIATAFRDRGLAREDLIQLRRECR